MNQHYSFSVSAEKLGLLNAKNEMEFDEVTGIVQKQTGADTALFSVIDDARDRQYFKSMQGLPEPWRSLRETPLSHSFCRIVRDTGRALVVEDAREDPRVRDNPSVEQLNTIAYAGFPVTGPDGAPIGALCAIDGAPHPWSEVQLRILGGLARLLSEHLRLRAALSESRRAQLLAERRMEADSAFFERLEQRVRAPIHGLRAMMSLLLDSSAGKETHTMCTRISASLDMLDDRVVECRAIAHAAREMSGFTGEHASVEDIVARLAGRELCAGTGRRRARHYTVLGEGATRQADARRLSLMIGELAEHLEQTSPGRPVEVEIDCRSDGALAVSVADDRIDPLDGRLGQTLETFLEDRATAGDGRAAVSMNLEITRRLAASMGGDVRLSSRPGEGTRIVVTLPLENGGLPQAAKAGPAAADAPPTVRRSRPSAED